MSPRYTSKIATVSHGEATFYDWEVLDEAGNRVINGFAPSSAAAALAAERAIWRLKARYTTAEMNTNDQDR
jgi:hypothetical protein